MTTMPADPRTLFASVFGLPYQPLSKGFREHAIWIMGPMDDQEDFLRSGGYRDEAFRFFCAYVNHRLNWQESPSLEVLTEWLDIWSAFPLFLRFYAAIMPASTMDSFFDPLLTTHLWCMHERGVCYRPEFALLVGFRGSFLWAVPYRDTYRRVAHGLTELEEVYDLAPVADFLTVFFGRRRRWPRDQHSYQWNESGPVTQPDNASCLACDVYIALDPDDVEVNKRLRSELGVLLGRE